MSEARVRSRLPGLAWPGLPAGDGSAILALQYQLAVSETWPAQVMQTQQLRLLEELIAHCERDVPFWRDRLRQAGIRRGERMTPALFARIPLLTRAELRDAGATAFAARLPPSHGKTMPGSTSGSTGMPLNTMLSERMAEINGAMYLRSALWHGLHLEGKLASMRLEGLTLPVDPVGARSANWGESYNVPFHNGPVVKLDLRNPVARLAEWLLAEQPDHILTMPSNAARLARHFREHDLRLPSLRTINALGETVSEDTRALCQAVFGVPIIDIYSGVEPGMIALQCPNHNHYHVASEAVLLEVLDSNNNPCPPGQIGRVVVTSLHNFAMPLIRYEMGDLAEAGGSCDCGRGLPVLNRILGRTRDLVRLPDGQTRFAHFGLKQLSAIPAIRQYRLAQVALDRMEFRIHASRELTAAERARMTENLHAGLGYPFAVDFTYVDELPRTAGGKYHDFISELANT